MDNRKVFNVIVDATALVSSVKKNARDGIKKWVNNGAIRLFVPLHTLEQITKLSDTRADRLGSDAKEALIWLDTVTEQAHIVKNGLVQIEGGFEAYDTWAEVEEFLLPTTLLSHESEIYERDDLAAEMEKSHLDDDDATSSSSKGSADERLSTPSSPESNYSATSPGIMNSSPNKRKKVDSATEPAAPPRSHRKDYSLALSDTSITSMGTEPRMPKALQPLFNHILWRIQNSHDVDADQGLGGYILLTNDPLKQKIAHRFGIRVKRIEQLRDIIAREDRDIKNRLAVLKRESESTTAGAEQNGDVVLKRPESRGSPGRNAHPGRLWDPNTFGRAGNPHSVVAKPQQPGQKLVPTGPANFASPRGRGGRDTFRGRAHHVVPNTPRKTRDVPQQDMGAPIDPDSFDRPRTRGTLARGGRGRRLWEPA